MPTPAARTGTQLLLKPITFILHELYENNVLLPGVFTCSKLGAHACFTLVPELKFILKGSNLILECIHIA